VAARIPRPREERNGKKRGIFTDNGTAHIYAARDEGYPTSPTCSTGRYRWPEDFLDKELKDGAPVFPGGGVITVYYGYSETRPRMEYSKHSSPW